MEFTFINEDNRNSVTSFIEKQWLTTNDNINAIRFYQKRGFDMARFYHNALNVSRKLKSQIPIIGDNGIPLQHEIEFEYCLKK